MSTNAEIYEQDFYAWTQTTADLLRAGKWHEIDQALLAEEVAGLGRDNKREIARRVQRLLKVLYDCRTRPTGRGSETGCLELLPP
jgi:hypothetical protein